MSTWTKDRIDRASALWLAGHSAGDIARILGQGLSRSAVIGKLYRLRVKREKPSKPVTLPYPEKRKSPPKAAKPTPAPKPQVVMQPTDANAKPWTERRFGECAFPISGEGADTWSCCAPTEATYCLAHRRIMFAKAPTKADRTRAHHTFREYRKRAA